MIKIFEKDLTFGQRRELYFKTFVNKFFEKTDGRDGDYIHKTNQKKLELKSETYSLNSKLKKRIGKESPNLFIETLSKIEENTSGGPKQAIEKNCYWYAHLFYKDIFVLFKTTEIFKWFEKNKKNYIRIKIPNTIGPIH